jgi:hypothetical protein
MSLNKIDEWREKEELDAEEILESDLSVTEVKDEVGSWGLEKKADLALDILYEGSRNRDATASDKLARIVGGVVKLKKANIIHRKKLDYLDSQETS